MVTVTRNQGVIMKTMSARDAKHQFGLLIDTARAEPVVVEKHGRPVVVVVAIEEFERLKALESADRLPTRPVREGE
ncbi:prevent-host-death family protein [Cereibacter ovatus]|uniref:Antitoxin n=2 Tax=Cereibacter ovatus TaxID=439529 RepID=A0A285D586_9RHOB|nr:prevent-host-death family protein [Cereibacter ovatus]